MRFSSFYPPAIGVQGSAPSITLGDLGYTGDPDATNGATVGTNLRLVGGTVVATDAAILNSAVTINGSGVISGIGTGSGAVIANSILESSLNAGRLVNLSGAGVFNSLANITTRNLSQLNGRTADQLTYVSGGATVESLRPAQALATVGARSGTNLYRTDGTTVMTQAEVRTAEGMILNQGSLATQSAVTPAQLPYATVANSFPDEDFSSSIISVNAGAYFGYANTAAAAAAGVSVDTDTRDVLQVIKSLKTPVYTGTAAAGYQLNAFAVANYIGVAAGGKFRFTSKYLIKDTFTGMLRARIYFTGPTGADLASGTQVTSIMADRRTVAQVGDLVGEFDIQVTVPTGASRMYFAYFLDFSAKVGGNSAAIAHVAKPGVRFVTDFAGLDTNAVRLGTNVRRADGTTLVAESHVLNSAVTIDGSGILTNIGTAGVVVNNNRITLSASGVLSGGGTSAQVNLGSLPGTITASQIQDGTITAAEIAPGTITAAEINDGAITSLKLASNSVTSGKIPVGSLIKLGEGSSTVILDGGATSSKRISVGNALPDAAPFSVTNTGKLKATDWELFDADGSLMLSKDGPTENFRLAILGRGANAPSQSSYSTSIKGIGSTAGATTSANTATLRVGDDSVVDIDLEWDLSTAFGTTYASFPSTVVFNLYRRFSTDNVTWGSWASQGTQTFTKAVSGASTTTYVVVETTLSSYPGEATVTSAVAATVIKPKMTISNASMSAGYYQFCVVDSGTFPTGPMSSCPIVMTFVDNDLTPSFIISDLPVGPVPFVNPTSGFKNLVIVSGPYAVYTSTDIIKVTADWIILSTPEGLTRTIPNFDYSLDLDNAVGVGSSAAALPITDTWMYIWAVSNGKLDNTGDGIVLSSSYTSAVITTHRYKCLVGAAYYEAGTGGVRSFIQLGNIVEYTDVAGAAITSGNVGSLTTPTWHEASTSTAVPPLALCREIKLHVSKRSGSVMVAPTDSYGAYNTSNANTTPPIVVGGSDEAVTTTLIRKTANIYYAANDANSRVTARGFSLLI